MSLNPRAIASLGVGFGALSVAYIGLWPVGEPTRPPGGGVSGPPIAIEEPLRRGFIDDRELLEILPIVIGVINDRS